MKIITFIIIVFALIQCNVTNNKQFSHREMIQNIVDTSYIMKYFDKMGIDSSEILNNYEAEYFNERFKGLNKNFDFTEKKVYFFGPGGLVFSDKQKYFSNLIQNNFFVQSDLHIFNESEKEESGGYDATIVYWSKKRIPTTDIVKKLKSKR